MREALKSVHEAGVLHGDIALRNFVCCQENPDDDVKLIDFGLSRFQTSYRHPRNWTTSRRKEMQELEDLLFKSRKQTCTPSKKDSIIRPEESTDSSLPKPIS
jgi:serine/threonine protein kinase